MSLRVLPHVLALLETARLVVVMSRCFLAFIFNLAHRASFRSRHNFRPRLLQVMAAVIDNAAGNSVTNGGYGGGTTDPGPGAFIGGTPTGIEMRWASVERQDAELRTASVGALHAKDIHAVDFTPLSAAATRISDVLAERYPFNPAMDFGSFDPKIDPTQSSVAFGRRAWTKLVDVLTEASSSTEDRRKSLVALLNRVARPESRSSMVRAGAVEALASLLNNDSDSTL